MARPGEETLVADSAAFLVSLLESVFLNVADGLHDDADAKANDCQNIGGLVESRLLEAIDDRAVQHSNWHANSPDLTQLSAKHLRQESATRLVLTQSVWKT